MIQLKDSEKQPTKQVWPREELMNLTDKEIAKLPNGVTEFDTGRNCRRKNTWDYK